MSQCEKCGQHSGFFAGLAWMVRCSLLIAVAFTGGYVFRANDFHVSFLDKFCSECEPTTAVSMLVSWEPPTDESNRQLIDQKLKEFHDQFVFPFPPGNLGNDGFKVTAGPGLPSAWLYSKLGVKGVGEKAMTPGQKRDAESYFDRILHGGDVHTMWEPMSTDQCLYVELLTDQYLVDLKVEYLGTKHGLQSEFTGNEIQSLAVRLRQLETIRREQAWVWADAAWEDYATELVEQK